MNAKERKPTRTRDYAVKVAVYAPSKGGEIAAIDLSDVPMTIRQAGYAKIEPEYDRLVIKRGDKQNGRRVDTHGRVLVQYGPMVEKLNPFIGRYMNLHFDAKTDSWYVLKAESLADKKPYPRKNTGEAVEKVPKKKGRPKKVVAEVTEQAPATTEKPVPEKPAIEIKSSKDVTLIGLKAWISEATRNEDYEVAGKLIEVIKEVSAL